MIRSGRHYIPQTADLDDPPGAAYRVSVTVPEASAATGGSLMSVIPARAGSRYQPVPAAS
jgi:hypothetical protein